jgi:hypothetical protein
MNRFELFFDALKKKYTAVMLCIGILFLVDFYLGCPVMRRFFLLQMHLFHVDPRPGHFRMVTFFGKFSSIEPVVRRVDITLGGIATLWALWQYAGPFFECLFKKKIV